MTPCADWAAVRPGAIESMIARPAWVIATAHSILLRRALRGSVRRPRRCRWRRYRSRFLACFVFAHKAGDASPARVAVARHTLGLEWAGRGRQCCGSQSCRRRGRGRRFAGFVFAHKASGASPARVTIASHTHRLRRTVGCRCAVDLLQANGQQQDGNRAKDDLHGMCCWCGVVPCKLLINWADSAAGFL
jgi:hypothetical protein